jgi:hypothetical protein
MTDCGDGSWAVTRAAGAMRAFARARTPPTRAASILLPAWITKLSISPALSGVENLLVATTRRRPMKGNLLAYIALSNVASCRVGGDRKLVFWLVVICSRYRSGRSPDWLKFKNPEAPAMKREAEGDWGR